MVGKIQTINNMNQQNKPTKREIQRYNQSMCFFVIALIGLILTLFLTGCNPYKAMYHAEAEKAEAFKSEISHLRYKLTQTENKYKLDSLKYANRNQTTKD